MISKILVLFCVLNFIASNTFNLRSVGDDDLLQLIKAKEKLVVLFTKPDCESCIKYEQTLESLDEELTKELSIETVRIENSHLCRLYSPTKEPAIVYFRHGIPLLYSGDADENEIFNFFHHNPQPAVKELTDKIFEHITQAATGATTGDWFVMFYGASCVECQRLHAVWEGVGANLRGRVNVARVDANLAGINTAKRFQVNKLPTFLFFRLGKVYKYDIRKHDVKSFVSFAQEWYKNSNGVPVALLASPFDEIVDWCVEWLKYIIQFALNILAENPWIWQVALLFIAGFGLVGITAVIAIYKARSNAPKVIKKEKKSK